MCYDGSGTSIACKFLMQMPFVFMLTSLVQLYIDQLAPVNAVTYTIAARALRCCRDARIHIYRYGRSCRILYQSCRWVPVFASTWGVRGRCSMCSAHAHAAAVVN